MEASFKEVRGSTSGCRVIEEEEEKEVNPDFLHSFRLLFH
jgi:hypothetical protein